VSSKLFRVFPATLLLLKGDPGLAENFAKCAVDVNQDANQDRPPQARINIVAFPRHLPIAVTRIESRRINDLPDITDEGLKPASPMTDSR
jgi:hypothetical protein